MDIRIRNEALSVRGSDFELTEDPINSFEFELLTAYGTNQADPKFGTYFNGLKTQPHALNLIQSETKRIMRKHNLDGNVQVKGELSGIHVRIETEVTTIEYVVE